MIPASNLKVLTSAAASAVLGDDYRFETKLYVRRDDNAESADVLIVGGGDPSFGDSAIQEDVRQVLDGWARSWLIRASHHRERSSSTTASSTRPTTTRTGPKTRSTSGTRPRSAG